MKTTRSLHPDAADVPRRDGSVPPPPGWGGDQLTAYLEAAHRNRFATYANCGDWFARLRDIDATFMCVGSGWKDPSSYLAAFLLLRCHAAFRGLCEHAMAGSFTEAFPLMRACLEYAGYALHIDSDPALGKTWLERHNDGAALAAVRKAFLMKNVQASIAKANAAKAVAFDLIYQRAIDYGGHPNVYALTSSTQIRDIPEGKMVEQVYLHGGGLQLEFVLKSTAQTGVCALDVLHEAFPERFSDVGAGDALQHMRVGL